MKSGDRKAKVLELIQQSKRPLSASALACHSCIVSRQIIVGDVALLRASGIQIICDTTRLCYGTKGARGIVYGCGYA